MLVGYGRNSRQAQQAISGFSIQKRVDVGSHLVFVDNAASESLQTGDRDVRVTLGAVNEIVRKMGSMPGQRALILILTMTPEALTMKSQILDLAAQSNLTIKLTGLGAVKLLRIQRTAHAHFLGI